MLIQGYPRHGGARLALAAGAQRHDLPRRNVLEFILLDEGKLGIEIAGLLRSFDHAVHGAADHHEPAPGGARGIGHGADAGDVRGEDGHRHAPRRLGDQALEGHGDIGLRGRHAVTDGVGRVANQRGDAFLAERLEARDVGRRAGQGVLIELPVGGMENRAEIGLDDHGRRLGDRVGHVDKLDLEWADGAPVAQRHDVQRKVGKEPGLAKLRLEHGCGEGRGVDGHAAKPRPKIDHGAEMILVRMGQE